LSEGEVVLDAVEKAAEAVVSATYRQTERHLGFKSARKRCGGERTCLPPLAAKPPRQPLRQS
jgi:hypothetical protein